MDFWYEPSNGGFRTREVHGEPPSDARFVSAERHTELLAGQSMGKRIVADAEGFPVLADPEPASPAQQREALKAQVQRFLDRVAGHYGYSSMQSAVSYADEPAVPKFQADGLLLRAYRSRVWDAALAVINDEAMIPSWDAVLEALPRLEQ